VAEFETVINKKKKGKTNEKGETRFLNGGTHEGKTLENSHRQPLCKKIRKILGQKWPSAGRKRMKKKPSTLPIGLLHLGKKGEVRNPEARGKKQKTSSHASKAPWAKGGWSKQKRWVWDEGGRGAKKEEKERGKLVLFPKIIATVR